MVSSKYQRKFGTKLILASYDYVIVRVRVITTLLWGRLSRHLEYVQTCTEVSRDSCVWVSLWLSLLNICILWMFTLDICLCLCVHLVVYCRSWTLNPESVIWNLYLLSDILLCCFANNLESPCKHLMRLTASCNWEHLCFCIIQWVLCFLILEREEQLI